MPPPIPPVRYRVALRRGTADLAGFLDMLRYEGARVVDWSHDSLRGTYSVVLESDRPAVDRWRSFLLVPVDVSTGTPLPF